jgi:CRP-like cAMP-binding protein
MVKTGSIFGAKGPAEQDLFPSENGLKFNRLRGGTMDGIERLKTIAAFEAMREDQLAAVCKNCKELQYKRGDRIFAEGDQATDLWLVMQGQVDLRFELPDHRPSSPEQTIASIVVPTKDSPAEIIGWSCFVEPYKMRFSAYCMASFNQIVRLEKTGLLKLFDSDPGMGYGFLSHMMLVVGGRFHQFQDHVAKNMGEDLMSGW